MITKIPFGATGHQSTRIIFGAAALGGMRQDKADSVLSLVMDFGINHFDVAASYGDAELRLAPFLQDHRADIFLATKTGDRTYDGAKASIENSLRRMQVEQLDLIQFHNLTQDADWDIAMGAGGALEAALEARKEGLVRFIGVTGHGTRVAEMHLKSLSRFEFDSVLLPYSYMSLQDDQYADEFEQLYRLSQEKRFAMQTIKSIARRRWREDDASRRFSWYEPLREQAAITRAVHFILNRPGIFLNSSSDATLLKVVCEAALSFDRQPLGSKFVDELEAAVAQDAKDFQLEPLFVRGSRDDVR